MRKWAHQFWMANKTFEGFSMMYILLEYTGWNDNWVTKSLWPAFTDYKNRVSESYKKKNQVL